MSSTITNPFDRNVFCVAGLPFDAVSQQQAIDILHDHIAVKKQCFLSTPNLNFVITSQTNQAFRDSVINSELSVADGMPIIWMAKMLGIPIKERIAGSSLFDEIAHADQLEKPVSVFFFGGQDGVAERACEQLNSDVYKGMQCVGFHNPGFGSVEDMSTDSVLEIINRSKADFVVVSLGAGKGQGWIEYNRDKLNTPVISHLGAVVNFIAGTVNRSPRWMQTAGLEWLWRIKEEPGLWRRYWSDGLGFIKMTLTQVLPYALWLRVSGRRVLARNRANQNFVNSQIMNDNCILISPIGCHYDENLSLLKKELYTINGLECKDVVFDLAETEYVDAAFIGLILLARKIVQNSDGKLSLVNASGSLLRVFSWLGASYLVTD